MFMNCCPVEIFQYFGATNNRKCYQLSRAPLSILILIIYLICCNNNHSRERSNSWNRAISKHYIILLGYFEEQIILAFWEVQCFSKFSYIAHRYCSPISIVRQESYQNIFLLEIRHAVDVIIPYVYDIGLSLIKSRRYLELIIINSVLVLFRVSHWWTLSRSLLSLDFIRIKFFTMRDLLSSANKSLVDFKQFGKSLM